MQFFERTTAMNKTDQALQLWQRWNQTYEQVTADMFDGRDNFAQLEQKLDWADQLRQKAQRLTRQCRRQKAGFESATRPRGRTP
jgi:hypothetical protein